MRATQMTSVFRFQNERQPSWVAHTPVGHDIYAIGLQSSQRIRNRQIHLASIR